MKTPPTLRRVKRALDHDGLAAVLITVDAGLAPCAEAAPPVAFGLRGLDDDGFDIEAKALDGADPVGSLVGFCCPVDWLAFGVVAPGRAHRPHAEADHAGQADADDAGDESEVVRVGLLVSRCGEQVSMLRHGDGPAELTAGPPAEGRLPDLCRRALGLSTAPPGLWPGLVWALVWLENLLAASLAEPGALTWDDAVRLHPTVAHLLSLDPDLATELPHRFVEMVQIVAGRTSWGDLRAQVSSGMAPDLGIGAEPAAWMDDGMFSRELLATFEPLATLVLELEPVAAPDVTTSVDQALDAWGAR